MKFVLSVQPQKRELLLLSRNVLQITFFHFDFIDQIFKDKMNTLVLPRSLMNVIYHTDLLLITS